MSDSNFLKKEIKQKVSYLVKNVPVLLLLGLSGCGTISTFQTGKTTRQGHFTFGMGSSGGLFRTKSKIVGFPMELAYGAIEVYGSFGLLDFVEVSGKAMATTSTDKGLPLYGGPTGRFAFVQERWGFPFSLAVGYAQYGGQVQSKQTDLQNQETKRDITKLTDKIYFVNLSKDIFSWFTIYGSAKSYKRTTKNFRYNQKILQSEERYLDTLKGGGAGVSFNVGPTRNTHIMLEYNEIRDDDEPQKHYQKQGGLGMSVEF